MKSTHKVYCKRVHLDSGGYDRHGTYWGVGQPLYFVFVECLKSYPGQPISEMHTMSAIGTKDAAVCKNYNRHKAWWTPYEKYVRANTNQEAIVRCRPAIGVAMFKLDQPFLVNCPRAFLRFTKDKG